MPMCPSHLYTTTKAATQSRQLVCICNDIPIYLPLARKHRTGPKPIRNPCLLPVILELMLKTPCSKQITTNGNSVQKVHFHLNDSN